MLKIYNSLTKSVEEFKPVNSRQVGMYTCGPTVYDFAHIGNFRTYTSADFLLRVLNFMGYKVKYIMNITDVGHLTGDNLGDASMGEDRMEKASKREGRSAWDIAKFYEKQFLADYDVLNLTRPEKFTRATEYIKEQIELIRVLEAKGFTYKTDDGIYFDTVKFPQYGRLSTLDEKGIDPGVRVEMKDKKNPRDFALWKFSPPDSKRQMEWNSPWGVGFPGWHIECSAMSMKYLGETLDVHTGGEDLRSTHHPNEIAQSEAATGKQFVKYWVHGAFINIDGARMSKSMGNLYTVSDIVNKGFDPMALRYLYMTVHYRQKMNFTWEALAGAQKSYESFSSQIAVLKDAIARVELSYEKLAKVNMFRDKFQAALENDLNMPQALAVAWEVIKSNIPSPDKYELLQSFNGVFGLKLKAGVTVEVPADVLDLARERQSLRKQGKFNEADVVREKINKLGYEVLDKGSEFEIRRKV